MVVAWLLRLLSPLALSGLDLGKNKTGLGRGEYLGKLKSLGEGHMDNPMAIDIPVRDSVA